MNNLSTILCQTSNNSSFSDFLKQNWIWFVVGIAAILLVVLVIVLVRVCATHQDNAQPATNRLSDNTGVAGAVPNYMPGVAMPNYQLPPTPNVQIVPTSVAGDSRQPGYDTLLNLIINTNQEVRDVKKQLEFYEKNELYAKQEAQLKAMQEELNKKIDTTQSTLSEQKEEKLKEKIEEQQKELDKIRQDQLIDKIVERLSSQQHQEPDDCKKKLNF